MSADRFIVAALVVQVLCAAFFVWTILESLLGLPPIGWQAYELIQIGAALGLVLGIVMGAIALRRARRRTARVEAQLRAASGAFMDLMQERFAQWGLTAAERDVALFSIKGLSTAEIAGDARDLGRDGQGPDQRDLSQGRRQRTPATAQPVHRGPDGRPRHRASSSAYCRRTSSGTISSAR